MGFAGGSCRAKVIGMHAVEPAGRMRNVWCVCVGVLNTVGQPCTVNAVYCVEHILI